MLITFKSRATADVLMFGDVAKALIKAMGKEVADKGVITPDQIPDALARLRSGISHEAPVQVPENATPEEKEAAEKYVSLANRAVPLIDMLERSLAEKKEVTWGV